MSEEMRNNPSAIFFTGTFTDKRIEQLSRKYGIDKENVNEIATKEVRLFLERIRQTNREKIELQEEYNLITDEYIRNEEEREEKIQRRK